MSEVSPSYNSVFKAYDVNFIAILIAWLLHRFGWFWIVPQQVSRPILNYCGAGLCLLR